MDGEIARQLGLLKHTVWLGCRDAERGEKAAAELRAEGIDAHALRLDVTNDASVKAAAATFAKASDTLDVLVNNAGVSTGGYAVPSEASLDDMHALYEVNVFGPVRVTQAFLPFLKKSGQGRIVMMSSGLGSIAAQVDIRSSTYGVNLLGYNSSKSALNMITVSFAKELMPHGIKVNAADPGYVDTDLNNHQGYRTVGQGAEIAVRLATLGPMGPTARDTSMTVTPTTSASTPGEPILVIRLTLEVLPALGNAVAELRQQTVTRLREGRTQSDVLAEALLPERLKDLARSRDYEDAAVPSRRRRPCGYTKYGRVDAVDHLEMSP